MHVSDMKSVAQKQQITAQRLTVHRATGPGLDCGSRKRDPCGLTPSSNLTKLR